MEAAAANEDGADSDSDDIASSMGFMFDSSHARTSQDFEVGGGVKIRLRMIKGDPGHVQSGQYLWPAAQFAAKWLQQHQLEWLPKDSLIVELGSGCGLAGLAAWHLPPVCGTVLTDYDYGSLQLLEENIAEAEATTTSGKQNASGKKKDLWVKRLEWGAPIEPSFFVPPTNNDDSSGEDSSSCGGGGAGRHLRIIGTDLVYSRDVVEPLLRTVAHLSTAYRTTQVSAVASNSDTEQTPAQSLFILFSSFDISAYDEELSRVCGLLGLTQRELAPLNAEDKTSRIHAICLN